MEQVELERRLAQSPLLAGVSLPAEQARVQSFPAGHILSDRPGGVPSVGLILSGRVEVYSVALDGKDVQLSTLPAGECFGVCNLLAGAELETVLRCGEETEVLYIPKPVLLACMERDAGLSLRYAELCNQKLQFLLRRIELLTMQSCRGRVIAHLLAGQDRNGCVKPTGSREDLARQLGVSRAALFRELAALQSMGVLRSEGYARAGKAALPPLPHQMIRKGSTVPMKKLLSLFCTLSLSAALLAGCSGGNGNTNAAADGAESTSPTLTEPETTSQQETAAPVDVNVMALKGPTAMGMVEFMSQADTGELTDNNYHFSITAATDEVSAALAQGTTDLAAVPANLASVLYNNTEGGVQVLAINTLGVLYIVESGDTVHSVEDLRGKTIYASGKGNTPEYALNYVLTQNGIDPASDVTIEWKSEQAECLSALMAEENTIAMLPQPFVTTAQTKSENIRVALDLTEEWDEIQAESDAPSTLVTGVVVGRTEFVAEHPEAVSAFLEHYRASVEYVNANADEAAQLVGQYEIVAAEVAQKALPECNIVFIEGVEMKDSLSGYLSVLFEQNPKSVGGALPDDAFYYSR